LPFLRSGFISEAWILFYSLFTLLLFAGCVEREDAVWITLWLSSSQAKGLGTSYIKEEDDIS